MKDAGVGLERLLGCEGARNGGVSAQCHRSVGSFSRRGIGEICDGVMEPYSLATAYHGDNLWMFR